MATYHVEFFVSPAGVWCLVCSGPTPATQPCYLSIYSRIEQFEVHNPVGFDAQQIIRGKELSEEVCTSPGFVCLQCEVQCHMT